MFDLMPVIRLFKMRWTLTRVAVVFLLAVTPASAQDYEAIPVHPGGSHAHWKTRLSRVTPAPSP